MEFFTVNTVNQKFIKLEMCFDDAMGKTLTKK